MRDRIAVLAPTLFTQLPADTLYSELESAIRDAGFRQMVSVADYFMEFMISCERLALTSGKPVLSSACPVTLALAKSTYPTAAAFVCPFPSPAESAVLATARFFPDSDITFVSPCPAKAAMLEKLRLPGGVGVSCVRAADFLTWLALAPAIAGDREKTGTDIRRVKNPETIIALHSRQEPSAAPSYPGNMPAAQCVRHVFDRHERSVPVLAMRGQAENHAFFSALDSGDIHGPIVADTQLCEGGCRGGPWC